MERNSNIVKLAMYVFWIFSQNSLVCTSMNFGIDPRTSFLFLEKGKGRMKVGLRQRNISDGKSKEEVNVLVAM